MYRGFLVVVASVALLSGLSANAAVSADPEGIATATPIKHLVVIFDENNSFDHYFGTYPYAVNPPGEPPFVARSDTPTVDGLTPELRLHNPNAAAPFRLDRSQARTCDNDNHYKDEQTAYDGGLLDKFVTLSATGSECTPHLAMGYYDGNTVTALWNYAQHFAMSDRFFASTFGTTVMGHLNLVAGQTYGAEPASIPGAVVNGSVIGNVDPAADDCSTGRTVQMGNRNVGDLLNAKGVSWGWFYGVWAPTGTSNGKAVCRREYNAHYAPFQYYASTANSHHLPPASVASIGQTDQANHQYDTAELWRAAASGTVPAVIFLKAPPVQTGHPEDSDPLAEQQFLVDTINRLQRLPQWRSMAILITYDDSDGWYDHVMPPIVSQSHDPANDALLGPTGLCGTPPAGAYQGRCGYGPRLPLLAISPFARRNYVAHTVTDFASIIRFIEDNWHVGRLGDQSFDAIAGPILDLFDFGDRRTAALFLAPDTGEPVPGR
ncbi:MAG TPA: alkaline phosphatase family protein [bacterium]|nr:alkaline phosphatase family protein [bacterium]